MKKQQIDNIVSTHTLSIAHIFDGEEVVTGGSAGQTHVATFTSQEEAYRFVRRAQKSRYIVVRKA